MVFIGLQHCASDDKNDSITNEYQPESLGQTRLRVDSHESFHQLSSTIINLDQTRTRIIESPSRVTTNERKLSLTLMKNLACSKSMRADESACEFQAKGEREFELSSLFGPGLSVHLFEVQLQLLQAGFFYRSQVTCLQLSLIAACLQLVSFFSGLLAVCFHSSLLVVSFYLLVRSTVACDLLKDLLSCYLNSPKKASSAK